jgi:folate-dependent phosphoribosylglycinamide formyltransferase PurN
MALVKLYDAKELGPMNVAGFMSGSGTNLVKLIEYEQRLKQERGESPYHVAVIFSDNPDSNAVKIGSRFAIPTFTYSLESFCAKNGVSIKDMGARAEYEKRTRRVINQFGCGVVAYAGYMRKATEVFVNSFLGVNVHPADLTIEGENGKPKYRGDHAVRDAIMAGEKEIRSTTHLVSNEVDCGGILMVSAPVKINYPIVESELVNPLADLYQTKLKEKGDWVIFPKTLEYIADGRFAWDGKHNLFFHGGPIPNGIRLEGSE